MSAETPLLSFSAADVGYGSVRILAEVDLAVSPGEVVGLIGPNGAGKSTLLRAVTGDSDLLSGGLALGGHQIASLSARDRARVVAVVPQTVSAAFSFPGAEFVAMARHPHLPRFASLGEADVAAVERAMELTDTTHLAQRAVDELSGGDLQRLAFAQALAAEPQLLLLDEPTSHLDLNHRLQVLDLTRDLADSGLAVLAVFHDLDMAARYSDRIAVVAGGRVAPAAPPADVITAETLHRVFSVRAVVGVEPVTGAVSVTPVMREGARATARPGRVLVIGGAGSAAPLMRRLVREGWEVTAGALNAGDADATLATALGIEFAEIPPFAPMDAEAAIKVATLAEAADAIVVSQVPFGHGNVDNLLVAVRAGKPVVLVGPIEGRDFAGGAAASYWVEALTGGAVAVANVDETVAALAAAVLVGDADAGGQPE